MSTFRGFHKKTRRERLNLLKEQLSEDSYLTLAEDRNLPETTASQMTENHIGTFALPMSVIPEFKVNSQLYSLPLVTEEPSVVAALSYANKIIARSGGFTSQIHSRLMLGQVVLYSVPDMTTAVQTLSRHETQILEAANAAHPSIVRRGGGARHLKTEIKDDFLIVYLAADVQEAMGANMINNMLEAIKPHLAELTGGQALMAILSNYATESLVSAQCRIPANSIPGGKAAAQKIELASRLAQIDPYRAATHNKGIFNGIDALVLATGNDWRAIEAGGHAYASRKGSYQGLAVWELNGETLVGRLTMPLPIASVGGSIGLNPKVKAAFDLLGNPDAKTLASIAVAVGLGQNFAAVRALVTTGIQAGHMKLQAKSLAMLAGAQDHEIDQVVKGLQMGKHINLEQASMILKQLRQE